MILTADNFDCHFTSDAGNIVGHGGGLNGQNLFKEKLGVLVY